MDPIWGYQAINVEAQQSDPSSLLHWTRNMIALRKLFQVFGRGTLEFLHPENRKVLAYIRDYQSEDGAHSETILCVANLSRFARPVALDLARFAGRQPMEMLGYVPFPEISAQAYPLTLAPYSFLWLELQPAAPPPEAPVVETGSRFSAPVSRSAAGEAWSLSRLLEPAGQAHLQQVLPSYIAQQRWFGGKSRAIATVRVVVAIPVPSTSAALTTIEVLYEGETSAAAELYQLPLSIATAKEAEQLRSNQPRSIIAALDGSENAPVLYDATADEHFRSALLRWIIERNEAAPREPGATGLASSRSQGLDASALLATGSRVSSAEQSNTSLLFDELAILKLFRRLHPGENPDVEMTRFLTDVAHFQNIPAYLGDLHRTDDGTTIAFLQAFAPNEGDGWAWTLDELARYYEAVATCPPPSSVGTPPSMISAPEPPPEAREHAGLYLDAAQLLGRRTAELHLALATPTQDPAFTAESFSPEDLASERERIEKQASVALAALERALGEPAQPLPSALVEPARALLAQRQAVKSRLSGLTGDPGRFGQRIRVHGDYHLGQLLRARTDFLLVDFEGEPARSLEERRRKQSPLRDVAGMLRSFSYAARSALLRHAQRRPEQAAALQPWATLWENSVSNAFLHGYRETISDHPLLPPPEDAQTLLLALLLEKASYELLYELNNRPTWVDIPLSGLRELLTPAT
jgi:maltose alpha-D-glucosyltransferase/alpha-amylase